MRMGWLRVPVAAVVLTTAGACGPNEGSPSASPATADPSVDPGMAAFERQHASTIGANELSPTEYLGILFDQQGSMLPGVDIEGSTRSTGEEYAERMVEDAPVVPLPDAVVDSASMATDYRAGAGPGLITYEVFSDARPSEIETVYEDRAVDEGWRVARDAVPPADVGAQATWILERDATSVLVLAERSEEFAVTVLRVLVVRN